MFIELKVNIFCIYYVLFICYLFGFITLRNNQMSDEENGWKWDEFVKIGNSIHKERGVVRIEKAQDALLLAKVLRRTEYLIGSKERYQLYKTLLPKIAEYLDGNDEVIKAAVEKYFYGLHCKAGLDEADFSIDFLAKRSGIQIGFICETFNKSFKTRYYIKTHQSGPTADNIKSTKPPDCKEIFIYKLLE